MVLTAYTQDVFASRIKPDRGRTCYPSRSLEAVFQQPAEQPQRLGYTQIAVNMGKKGTKWDNQNLNSTL
jgi:hypothetical protein